MTYFKTVPPGTILPFAGTTAPAGWLLCDGSAVSRTVYSVLFSKISTNFGNGDGSTTFHLPDMRGRFERSRDHGANRDPDKATRTASNPGGNTGDNVGSAQDHTYASHNHTNTNSISTGGESVDHNHGNSAWESAYGNHAHGVNGNGDHQHGSDDAYYSENYNGGGSYYGANHGGDFDNSVDTTSQTADNAGWHNHGTDGVWQDHYHATGTVSAWHTHSIPFSLTINADGGNETRPINANINYVIKI
jgi:microcystin-dependent protein